MIDSDSSECRAMQLTLNRFYKNVLDPMVRRKSPSKTARIIFQETRRMFLKNYVDTATVSSTFRTGAYNCVSGSAMYAVVLKHYGIPYQIHELPTHIYLVVNPGNEAILFESTSPSGYVQFSEKMKGSIVNQLLKMDYITKEKVEATGSLKAFDDYFFSKEQIDLINLAGVQYWNSAVQDYQASAFRDGLEMIGKSQLLYPSQRNVYLRTDLIDMALSTSRFDNLPDIELMAEYAVLRNVESERTKVAIKFEAILYHSLILNSNKKFCDESYSIFIKWIKKDNFILEIERIRRTYFGRYYLLKHKPDSALLEVDPGYRLNPNNLEFQNLISTGVFDKIELMGYTALALTTLEEAVARYKFLAENEFVKDAFIKLYAVQAIERFSKKDTKPAWHYFELLENRLTNASPKNLPETIIGYAYAEAGSNLFREHQYDVALVTLERGLKFAPTNEELKARIQITRDEMKAIANGYEREKLRLLKSPP